DRQQRRVARHQGVGRRQSRPGRRSMPRRAIHLRNSRTPGTAKNKDLDETLTRRSAVLTRPLRMRRTAAFSVGGERPRPRAPRPPTGRRRGRARPPAGGGDTGAPRSKAAGLRDRAPAGDLPESFGYSIKRRLLGPPMVNEELRHQRLSKVLALGVLSPDGISSSAYGTEEMLIELLPVFGIAAFTLILPMTGVILFVMTLVVLSYREVVTVYTRAGGSYVVARENFGPRIAQVAAVALLIDYVVTVAVQVAGGTAAVVSAIPALGSYTQEISVGVVLIMCFGNLRGI